MRTTLLIGATSAMAEQAARHFAPEGDRLLLAARDTERAAQLADDLRVRGAESVTCFTTFDASNSDSVQRLTKRIQEVEGTLDYVLIAHGHLPDQEECEEKPWVALRELQINFLSTVQLCTLIANRLEKQGHGTLAVLSSVAGLRGRQSNYIYGSAKGGMNTFLQGLRNRMAFKGVRVVTLLPGFVDTPMTSGMEKGPLFISADKAGRLIHTAMTKKTSDIVYIPGFWRWILLMIRMIPEPIFKRLRL